jgi:hypothetical protein
MDERRIRKPIHIDMDAFYGGFRTTVEGRAKRLRERLISEMATKGSHVATKSGA